MKRFRWALSVLAGLVVIGVAASAVLAGSGRTTATYWNNAIEATAAPTAGVPLGYAQTGTWTFGDVTDLYGAMTGSVYLNFAGHSASIWDGGGSGFPTTLKVVVTGVGTGTFSTTLANPWRPHVAYSNTSYGQDAYGSLNLPTYIWRNASSLKVTVTSLTTNTHLTLDEHGIVIGFTTLG